MKKSWMIAAAVVAAATVQAKPMNVVMILIDDLGHYGVTAYGADKIASVQDQFEPVRVETPRIDSLAKEGMLCEQAYAYPLCEPTRIALMSGKNNVRNYLRPKSQHASDITFGDLFQRAGYKTCVVGKWKQTRGTKEIPGEKYISEFGWDEFCCFDVTGEGRRMIEPNFWVNGKHGDFDGIDPITGRRYYGPDIINRYALDYLDRTTEDPFFLYYSMVLVHDEHTPTPDTMPKEVFDNFDINKPGEFGNMKGDVRKYYPDMLRYTDKMIGQVLDKLDERGLRENTLVVVMGDNGTKECFAHILPDGTTFVGGKGCNMENGLHVPLLLRAPGKIPAGKAYSGLINVTDICPTLCAATGVDVPNVDEMDGVSFWEQATGKATGAPREAIYTWYNRNNTCWNTENVIEYAFTPEFKRYAPSKDFPDGRFFDLRTDRMEEAGDRKVKVAQVWNVWHKSGLDLKKLTSDQRKAFNQLGKVLDEKHYVAVDRLAVRKSEVPVKAGDSSQLDYKVYPANASRQSVIWESSDPSIATIDKFGKLTAHKAGEVTVSAYSWDDAYPLAAMEKVTYRTSGIKSSVTVNVTD